MLSTSFQLLSTTSQDSNFSNFISGGSNLPQSYSGNSEMEQTESPSSCYICRNRKVRCGRQLPECGWCTDNGVSCIYPETSHKRHNAKKNIKQQQRGRHGDVRVLLAAKDDNYKQNVIKYRVKAKPNHSRLIKYLDPVKNFPLINRIIPAVPYNSFEWASFIQPIISASGHLNLMHYQKGQFESNLTKVLASQLITERPELLKDIEPFIKGLNAGNFDGLDKEYLSMSANWFNVLFDQTFKARTIHYYFKYFHPMVTYLIKSHIQNTFHQLPEVLKSVIICVGYQYSPDQDEGIFKYTEQIAKLQLEKNFYSTNIHNCQALFIYSYSLFYRGQAPKSLNYFHQGCRMALELGIQKNIPSLNKPQEQVRKTMASMMLFQDRHFSLALNIEPYFSTEFNTSTYYELDYTHQVSSGFYLMSAEEQQFSIAEAKSLCLVRKVYDLYWVRVLTEFVQLRTQVQVYRLSKTQIKDKLNFLEEKLDKYLILSLQEFLNLDKEYNSPRCRELIREYVSIFTLLYHKIIILLSSHRVWNDIKEPIPKHVIRAHISAQAILKISTQKVKHFENLHYHYLSVIGFFYLHLLVKLGPHHDWNFPQQLQRIYMIFKRCPTDYFNKTFEVIRVICNKFQIHFNI
jgi:hypothetical protein